MVLAGYLSWTYFPAGGNDDSYITYWAAYALSAFGRIINYNGEVIEQSSSLLQVLVLALVRRAVNIEPHLSGPLVSILAGLLCVPAVAWACRVGRIRVQYGPPLLVGSCAPLLYWSGSGMESSLAALVVVTAVVAVSRCIDQSPNSGHCANACAALLLLACVLVRPETPLLLLASMVGLLGVRAFQRRFGSVDAPEGDLRKLLMWTVLLAAMVALTMGFRRVVFGGLFPNPALSKTIAFDLGKGFEYLLRSVEMMGIGFGALIVAGVVYILALAPFGRIHTVAILAGLFSLMQIGFVCQSGGDWMPAGRLLVPAVPMFGLAAGVVLDAIAKRTRFVAVVLMLAVVAHGISRTVDFGKSGSNSSLPGGYVLTSGERTNLAGKYGFFELHSKGHRRDAWLIESLIPRIRAIRSASRQPFTMMSGQAGMVPYYVFREFFGRGSFIDLFSLTSRRHLPCVPKNLKRPAIHGIGVPAEYFAQASEGLPACNVARPNIWFSTGSVPKSVANNGFRVVYVSRPGQDKAWAAIADE
jgi:hypothetical protein